MPIKPVKLYKRIRQMMAAKHATKSYLGPIENCTCEDCMSKEEYKAYKASHYKETEINSRFPSFLIVKTETVSS